VAQSGSAIYVEVEADKVVAGLRRLDQATRRAIISQSANRGIKHLKTLANRKVRETIALRAKDVNAALSVRHARRGGFDASLEIRARAVALQKFGARQTKRGVSVRVKKRGPKKRVSYAFKATMQSGHVGVFARDSKRNARRGPKPNRSGLPIKELYGPEVIDVLNDPPVLEELVAKGGDVMVREIIRRVGLAWSR